MKEHDMIARISQLHKTESEWNKLENFRPFSGEIIVFDQDENYNYVRLKVGDGKTLLKDLPFFIDSIITKYMTNYRINEVVDAGRITEYK